MTSKGVLMLLCIVAAVSAETYTDKYDNIDLKEIMTNRRLLLAYVNCLLDKGKCSPEGKELKQNLKDALDTNCEKCTDAQKKGGRIMIDHLMNNELAIWNEITAKFDPDGTKSKAFKERGKANG